MFEVCVVNEMGAVHQAFRNQPGLERVGVRELLGPVLQVDGVHKCLDESDVAGCGFAVSHDSQYIHNRQWSNIGYTN